MTKIYKVFGVGNALVDIEYKVSTDFLNRHGIPSGVMELVDLEEQEDFLIYLSEEEQKFVKKAGGGSAANSMVAMAQLGSTCFYACKVGEDHFGEFFCQDLTASGLHFSSEKIKSLDGNTGKCLVFISEDAERSMKTHLGISNQLSVKDIDENALMQSEYVYGEGYLLANDSGLNLMSEVFKMARKHQVKTAITFSDPNMVAYFKKSFLQVMEAGVDLIFCNEKEAQIFTGLEREEDYCNALSKLAPLVIITQGPRGATALTQDKVYKATPKSVKAVDTNGAGDMFAGSFFHTYLQGNSIDHALNFAVQTSSALVTQFGARMDKLHLTQIYRDFSNEYKH